MNKVKVKIANVGIDKNNNMFIQVVVADDDGFGTLAYLQVMDEAKFEKLEKGQEIELSQKTYDKIAG